MRLEDLPVLLGVIVAVAGAIVVADAWTPDATDELPFERRRRERPERHHFGEGIFGGGLILIALALMGGDGWAYTTLAIGIAIVLVVVGTALNLRYFRGLAFGPVLGRTQRRRASDRAREAQGLGTGDSGLGK